VVEEKPKVVKPQIVCDESLIGLECLAVYKADGREYPAIIKRVFPQSLEVTVEYTGYNENAIVKVACIRFGAPKPKINGGGKQGGAKQGGGNKGGGQQLKAGAPKGGNKGQQGRAGQQAQGHAGAKKGGR